MKSYFLFLLLATSLFACAPKDNGSAVTTADSTTTEAPAQAAATTPPAIEVVVPEKGADWVDHKINGTKPKLMISAPKGIAVSSDAYGIYVRLDEDGYMGINPEAIQIAEEKQDYMERTSRKNLVWVVDNETEKVYTGLDLSAPEGHQTTNSFFATKKIGNADFSTNVDGISVKSDTEIYQLRMNYEPLTPFTRRSKMK